MTASTSSGSLPSRSTVRARRARVVAGDLDTGAHVDALPLERAEDDAHDVLVDAREDLGQRLEHRDLAAEVVEHRGELAADGAAADDGHPLRHLAELEHLVGGEDRATDVEAGDGPRHRARRQDHRVAVELGGAAVGEVDGDAAIGAEPAGAGEHRDLAVLQQTRQALEQRLDHAVLASHGRGHVDRGIAGLDAELLGPAHRPDHVARLEQGLGRDAATVEAGATDLVLLDEGDVQACGRAVEGGGVATGTTTDDDDVKVLCRGNHLQETGSEDIDPADRAAAA